MANNSINSPLVRYPYNFSPMILQAEPVNGVTYVGEKQLYELGTKYEKWDGREYRYARSTGAAALYSCFGCEFSHSGYISITTFATSHSVGDFEIRIPAATHSALTADELRGGYVIIFDGDHDYYTTLRMIVGNEPAAANASFRVALDDPLTYPITSGVSKCEVYANPWGYVTIASSPDKPKAGIPVTYVPAAVRYFWVQRSGITWAPPQTSVNGNGGIGVYWRHDGSLEGTNTALGVTTATYDTSQLAGYVVAGSQAGNGPLVMLI